MMHPYLCAIYLMVGVTAKDSRLVDHRLGSSFDALSIAFLTARRAEFQARLRADEGRKA